MSPSFEWSIYQVQLICINKASGVSKICIFLYMYTSRVGLRNHLKNADILRIIILYFPDSICSPGES